MLQSALKISYKVNNLTSTKSSSLTTKALQIHTWSLARWSATNPRAVLLITSKECELTSELWSFQEERETTAVKVRIWCTRSFPCSIKKLQAPRGTPVAQTQTAEPSRSVLRTGAPAFFGACGAGTARAVLPLGGRDVPGSLSCPPSRLGQGPGRCCAPSHLNTRQALSGSL